MRRVNHPFLSAYHSVFSTFLGFTLIQDHKDYSRNPEAGASSQPRMNKPQHI